MARVFIEEWQGYAAQKNSAISKAQADWVLLLDADESADQALIQEISQMLSRESAAGSAASSNAPANGVAGYFIPRKNYFLGRWICHGGFWPDPKLRLFRRGAGRVEDRAVHETIRVNGTTDSFGRGALVHHSYPTLSDYIEHMNRYSSLGAQMAGPRGFSVVNIALRPFATFIYNYFFRLGFLDGREGLLLHLYHAVYVSWKYAKAWESQASR
jgi:glycosyltransferase involved in cell wall biosynthesis